MRTPLLGTSLLGLILMAMPARAGVYLPPEQGPFPMPTSFRGFTSLLDQRKRFLPAITSQEPQLKKEVDELLAPLEEKRKAKTLSVEEGIRLGGYYILRNQYDAAIKLLSEVHQREPKNFMAIANLATAYFGGGLPDRAVRYQEQLLDPSVWPRQVSGWTAERLRWQRRVEVFYLNFLRLRAREIALPPTARPGELLRLDDLFPGVRFVGREGKYVAGEIDPRAMDRLPPDALALVEQLVLWFPEDLRLLWLLGELFNAHGDIRAASYFVSGVRDKGIHGEGLDEHRRVLARAKASLPEEKAELPSLTDTDSADSAPQSWLPDLKTLGIGFGVGTVIGALVVLQLYQLFRRR
jgi:hypothetical protein